jgi:hypothetical protein
MIEAHQTGRVRLMPTSPSAVIMVEEDTIRLAGPLAKREYYLGVRLRIKGYADSDDGADMVHLKEMCKRQILDEVFGEFRPLLRRLERAIYEMNFDDARTALADLENEMRW